MLPPDLPLDADPSLSAPAAPMDPSAPPPNPMITVPLTEDDRTRWKGDLERANTRRKVFEPAWERNLKSYSPDPTNEKWGDEVNPGVDFYQVEQKKALLFFETPSVVLTPEDDAPPDALAGISAHQAKLNQRLGRKGLDAERMMDEVLFAILCPAGMGCVKVGVTRVTKDVPMLNPANHPTAPGAPQMDAQGQPVTAPVPVYQKIFGEHFSEKKALIPTSFHSTQFDKAPWLGMKFTMPTRIAARQFNLTPEVLDQIRGKHVNSDDQVFVLPGVKSDTESDEDTVTGTEVWYQAALYDDNVYHPDHMRQLVFLDGVEEEVVSRDSPYQTFQQGVFVDGDALNLIGNPIHIFTVRDLSDSAYVPSDCTITRPLVNELRQFRTQLIEMRDSSTSIRIADELVITPEVLSKIVRGPFGAILPVANYDPGRPPIMEVAHPVYSRENFTAQDKIEQDLAKVNTLSANQTGTQQDTVRSATELSYVQKNSDVRMQKERNRILAGFIGFAQKIDALVKRFETPAGQPPVSGYTYDIKPDSGMHVDAASDRKFALDRYNMLAKDPNVNRSYLLKELSPDLRLDPAQLIVQPPPPKPEPPKFSFIIKGEDLSPLMPQYPNMQQALAEAGVQLQATPITPQLVQNAALSAPMKPPTPSDHGGSPPQADKVSQHTEDRAGHPANFGGKAA